MVPDAAVDIGNGRMKWWFCGRPDLRHALHRLDPDDPEAHAGLLARLGLDGPLRWAVASVHPRRAEAFVNWLAARGHECVAISRRHLSGLPVEVDAPDLVGIDRLLNALAAKSLVSPGTAAIAVDVGTATTVDLLDERGRFVGGAIFPGPALMARALHDHTAQLPLVDSNSPVPALPARNTAAAIRAGTAYAALGGIAAVARSLAALCRGLPEVFVTGGGAAQLPMHLRDVLDCPVRYEPFLTLEGVRLAAGAMP